MKRRYFVMGGGAAIATSLTGCDRGSQEIIRRAIRVMEAPGGAAIAADSAVVNRDLIEKVMFRAFLRMIYFAEGTYPNAYGMNPYKIIFGYRTFEDFSDHPRQCYLIPNDPRQRCSDAAGICQAISTTWDETWDQNPDSLIKDIPYFHPRNQDRFMAVLCGRTGAYWKLAEGTTWDAEKQEVFTTWDAFVGAANAAAVEWASIPLSNGLSIGHDSGQSPKPMRSLWDVYQQRLNEWKA